MLRAVARRRLGKQASTDAMPVSRAGIAALAMAGALALAACAGLPAAHAPIADAGARGLPGALRYEIPPMPEGPSGYQAKPGWSASRHMVAAANPLATDAGFQVLNAGGNALDAAIAVQMVLTLVEPQSSGIGGGAFLLHWDGQALAAWDGRETAPAAADEKLFLQADGKPMPFAQAVVGGRSVGVPGVVRMLEAAHRVHGRLPWAQLFAPAIVLAEQGFALSPRLHTQLKADAALRRDPLARAYFFDAAGDPWPVGHRLRNPALAQTLRDMAARGSLALHTGAAAADIVRRVTTHPTNPGVMTAADLASYQPVRREALCTDWQATWRVCGMPPPSSGHLAVMQILGVLERMPRDGAVGASPSGALHAGLPGPDLVHRYAEAARLAYADRAQYVGDPAFVEPPGGAWTSLLEPTYLEERAALVGARSMGTARAGVPRGTGKPMAAMPPQPEQGTSHLSIVDGEGRAVAMTTTIEAVFGSRTMSDGGTGLPGGFLLNNELTDFALAPHDAAGQAVANRVQPGKRPRSSMSPTLVFDRRDGRLVMSLGSPGGAAIIHFTAKTLLGTLEWGLDAQRAIDLPNFGSFNGPTVLERGRFPATTIEALKQRGHEVQEIDMTSGLQAIQRTRDGWFGGADPRREGIVMGR